MDQNQQQPPQQPAPQPLPAPKVPLDKLAKKFAQCMDDKTQPPQVRLFAGPCYQLALHLDQQQRTIEGLGSVVKGLLDQLVGAAQQETPPEAEPMAQEGAPQVQTNPGGAP